MTPAQVASEPGRRRDLGTRAQLVKPMFHKELWRRVYAPFTKLTCWPKARPDAWLRLALALLLLAPAAWAQSPAFSPAPTEACLAGAADASARAACVGRSADACMASDGGSSTAGMAMCLDGEARFWDARLNAAYAALLPVEQAADRDNEGLGAPSAAAALRDMQRAWIVWRDAACAFERSQWGGGTGAGPAGLQCLMQLTAEQALDLERRLAEPRN